MNNDLNLNENSAEKFQAITDSIQTAVGFMPESKIKKIAQSLAGSGGIIASVSICYLL